MNKLDPSSKNAPDTKVILTFPEKVRIDFVQANELKGYERFQWLVILLAPIASGFWTAFFTTAEGSKVLIFSSVAFSIVTLLFVLLSWRSRGKIFDGKVQYERPLNDFRK